MELTVGSRVRLRSSGDVGVVTKVGTGPLVQCFFGITKKSLNREDLELLPAEPDEQLLQGQTAGAVEYGLRVQGLFLRHAYRFDPLSGLSNARVEPQLHQVFVAHRVLSKMRPRMILADEVGLGKTIEAGLILKELRARQLVDRVLVVCPANLQVQWKQELASKFNENFEVMSSPALSHFGLSQENPFDAVRGAIVSQHLLMLSEARRDQVISSDWDLVIFDEGHRVRRTPDKTTRLYELASELRNLTLGMLVLTATPMQLDPYEFWSLIDLVEPGMYASYHRYEQVRLSVPRLNRSMLALRKWPALDRAQKLEAWASSLSALAQELGSAKDSLAFEDLDEAATRRALQERIVEAHPLADVMVRNRKSEIGGFARRTARRVPVQLRDDERRAYQAVNDYLSYGYDLAASSGATAMGFLFSGYHKMLTSSSAAIAGSLARRRDRLGETLKRLRNTSTVPPGQPARGETPDETLEESEQLRSVEDIGVSGSREHRMAQLEKELAILDDLLGLLDPLKDSKVARLVELVSETLREDPAEKFLVFTQFLETQAELARSLEAAGVAVAVFNGTQGLHEKELAVQRFRDSAQVLVSTEAGGEGRNLQFAHLIVNFDLPWNPMKVEQRIGRVDRIGQQRDVEVVNLFNVGTQEERVLDVLEQRIRLFEESVGSLDPILGEVEEDLKRLLARQLQGATSDELDRWEATLEQKMHEARLKEESLADFVLDSASLRQDQARALLAEHDPLAKAEDLRAFARSALRHFGGEVIDQDDGSVELLMPPDVARSMGSEVPGNSYRGIFDPVVALKHDEVPFLAFGHPVIDTLVDISTRNETVTTTVQHRGDVPPGVWVEAVYEVDSNSLRRHGRFFRVLVNAEGETRTEDIVSVPPLGDDADIGVPGWAETALAACQLAAEEVLEDVRVETAKADMEHRDRLLGREQAVHEHTVAQAEGQISRWEEQIRELELTGTEKQQRIVPALRGRITKKQQHIEVLRRRYEERADEIRSATSSPSLDLVAASVVVS